MAQCPASVNQREESFPGGARDPLDQLVAGQEVRERVLRVRRGDDADRAERARGRGTRFAAAASTTTAREGGGGTCSNAPMSTAPPTTRAKPVPRWSNGAGSVVLPSPSASAVSSPMFPSTKSALSPLG